MTALLAKPSGTRPDIISITGSPDAIRWHRPLLVVAAAMVLLGLFALVARFIYPVQITGLNQWDKPLKFALSTLIYTVTWSWLIGQMKRWHRLASVAGTTIAIALVIELGLITGAAATGTTSHFNVSTPFATAVWAAMAISISILWISTFLVAILLFFTRFSDAARAVAIRGGAVISVVGLGLAYLMTGPTAAQLDNFQGIAGAHTVGLADGGPGLPVLGWSTVAGDLRIPHFIGMHALQAIPLVLLLIELMSRRVLVLRDVTVRLRLVWVAVIGYAAVVALVTWQALRGQSIALPDAATLVAAGTVVAGVVAGSLVILVRARARSSATASAEV